MKRFVATLVALALAATPQVALADHITGHTGWYVEYTSSDRMEDNYTQKSWADNVSSLQPGDDITLTVEMRHSNENDGDWYLSNEVLKSLEEGDAKGSAYGYKLSYEGPSNSRTLYESETVGGIGSAEGLIEATNAMDDYFYLGTLKKGETGKVMVTVSLDGETEGNAYFDTLARLQLKFAVEHSTTDTTNKEKENKKERTQDTSRTTRNTESNPKSEERVTQTTTNNVNRPNDSTTQTTSRTNQVTPQSPDRPADATTQNIEYVQYVIEEQPVPATNIVNRIIPGTRAGLSKTGDETTLFPLYASMVGAGFVVLAVAIRIVRKRGTDEKGDVQ